MLLGDGDAEQARARASARRSRSGTRRRARSADATGITSRATKRRTVAMISSRTSGSVSAGNGGRGASVMRERYLPVLVLTSISIARRMFPMAGDAMHARARAGGRAVRRPRRGARSATSGGRSRTSTSRATGSPATSPAAGVGAGDRVAVMTANRVEFVVAVARASASSAPPRSCSARRGRRCEVDHAVALTQPVHAVADGDAAALLGERARRRAGHRPRRRPRPGPPWWRPDDRPAVGGRRRRRRVRCWSSARARPGCPRPCATRTVRWATPPCTGCEALGLGPDDRFQVATPPSHILGLLNLLAAAVGRRHGPPAPRFDLDEVLRRIESDRMTLEMAVAPDRPGDGQPPGARGLRPLLAALHHVGRHPGERERRRRRHRAHRRPVAAGLRRQRAAR